jgi:predicted RND superfamily exporter protein
MLHLLLKKPIITLSIILATVAYVSTYIPYVNIDASPDSLLLDSDPDLKYYREIHRHYGSEEYVIVGFTPAADLYAPETIKFIEQLTEQFNQVSGVTGTTSMSNVPLLEQRDESAKNSSISFLNLSDDRTNIDLAKKEFANSPLYTDNLVSPDAATTAFKIDIQANKTMETLQEDKYVILDKLAAQSAHEDQLNEQLKQLNEKILEQRDITGALYKQVLTDIRAILETHQSQGEFYLAGGPLIANDIKDFVNSDIKTFGISIILMMCLVLFVFFRNVSWVFLPLICAIMNVILVAGLLGLFGLQLTIISSNFVSLLIIFSTSLSIHVIIRYQEICSKSKCSITDNITEAAKQIATPCIYMVATSVTAFFSLIASDIKPVINFGIIMIIGLLCAFLLAFTLLPILIKIINPPTSDIKDDERSVFLAKILAMVMDHKTAATLSIVGLFVISLFGISQITVENRFIDYFKSNTDIHQGLLLIDQDLGGTVPLEVVLEAPTKSDVEEPVVDQDDEFADFFDIEEESNFTHESYWYNRSGIKKIRAIHKYLEDQEQIGKVLSLSSTEEVFRTVNKGEELEDFYLAIIYKKAPDLIKNTLISPYISEDGSQARVLARVKDSDKTLVRNDLLKKINEDIGSKFIDEGESFRLSGVSVLYNNVLQSLFRSQILTLGTVFVCILLMLLILFRSLKLAIIGTIPNVFTAFFILGSMGLLNIPLDIMTITIAAITIGIGVDYTIHYIHRFKKEIKNNTNYPDATYTVQTTVGKALYYTSVTITIGFIILTSSSFKPSIYFGLFTSIAMLISLLATFTIIPLLLNYLRPIKVNA